MLLDDYQMHERRVIMQCARRSKSLSELEKTLQKRGVKMKYTAGLKQRIVFSTQRNFRIDSKFGKDRVFTDLARKTVDRNAKLSKVSEQKFAPRYNRFAIAHSIRTNQPKNKNQSQSLKR